MKTVSMGNRKKTFPSIKAYAEAHDIPYMTAYMRLRFGMKASTAATKPIRKYKRNAA